MKKHHRRKWSKKRNIHHSGYFLKDCNSLPLPIEPEDVKKIIKKIRGKPRDKAMILGQTVKNQKRDCCSASDRNSG